MKQALTRLHTILSRNRILPSFDEDTVFLLAVAVLAVLAIDADARAFAEQVRAHSTKITLIVMLGIAFAIYTAFFTYFKNEIQKFYMFWFAVLMNFLAAFASISLHINSSASSFSYLAPGIAITITLLMIIFWHADVLDASTLPYKASSYTNILYGTLIVLGFVFVAEFVWDMHWTSVVTVAIGYATVFNMTVSGYLPQIFGKRDTKISVLDEAINRGIEHILYNLNAGKYYDASIVTKEVIKDTDIPSEYKNNIEIHLADEVRKLNRTNPVAVVVAMGTYTFKRYAFSRTRQEMAVIVYVYPNDGTTGYQFCQMIKYNTSGKAERYRGLIYLNKIKNIFT